MFDADSFSWVLVSQIIAAVMLLFGGYALIFWTPVGYVAGFMWYDYLKVRFSRKAKFPDSEQELERTCWRRYQRWVNVGLAWRLGLDLCRRRAERSWLRSLHATIYEILSTSTPPSQVTACANGFVNLEQENCGRLARYMSRELTGGQVNSRVIGDFLREEQRQARSDPSRFLGHADRLAERFGIRPFIVQKWAADDSEEGTP